MPATFGMGGSGHIADPVYVLSSASFCRVPSCPCVNVDQLEQPLGRRRGPNRGPDEPRHHGGGIVSSVDAILELGELARHELPVDRPVGSNNGGLDIARPWFPATYHLTQIKQGISSMRTPDPYCPVQ